jgi:hypothetical protein
MQSLLALPSYATELAVQALSAQKTPELAVREVSLQGARPPADVRDSPLLLPACAVLLQYERLGFSTAKRPAGPVLWFHALSIGELAACLPSAGEAQHNHWQQHQQGTAVLGDSSAGSTEATTMVRSMYVGSRVCASPGTGGNSRAVLSSRARLMQQTWLLDAVAE